MFLPWATRSEHGFSSSAATVIASAALGPVQVNCTKARSAGDGAEAGYRDPGDAFVWAFVTNGSIVTKRATPVESAPGTLHISQMSRVDGFRMTPDFRAISIRLDRRALPLTSVEIDAVGRASYPSREGVPLLLGAMAAQVLRTDIELGPTSRAAVAQSILDLTAAFVDDVLGRRSAPESTRGSLVAAARHHIDQFASSPLLTPARIADALQVSVRTLHKAFEQEGTTVAGLVLQTRLRKARTLLEREEGLEVSVERIGLRAGFASASAFSRAFRAHHGMPPSEWRRRGLDLERRTA